MNKKRNEYLDITDEEDDIVPVDEEEQGRSTRISQPSSKRRKLSPTPDASDDEGQNQVIRSQQDGESADIPQEHSQTTEAKSEPLIKPSTSHQRKKAKTGVIYISRIPPFMKPTALRHLLTPYGTLLRIFLTPEPSPAYLKRKRSGGNKKRSFIDGWVEFASKKKAKICAETLNGNIIGGKKGGWYHDDIWNVKYLRGFKWDDLMEQVQDEERARESRLRAEMLQEARDRKAFMENVEREKMEKTRESKKKKRGDDATKSMEVENQRLMFTQNKVKQKDRISVPEEPEEQVKRVLSKVF